MMKKYLRLLPLILLVCGCMNNLSKGNVNQDSPVVAFYNQKCAGCHGLDGHPSRDGVPDFTDPDFQKEHTDEDLNNSITNGKPPRMPSYREKLDDQQIKEMVAYVRALAKKDGKNTEKDSGDVRADNQKK